MKLKKIILVFIFIAVVFTSACANDSGNEQTATTSENIEGLQTQEHDSESAESENSDTYDPRQENLQLYSYPDTSYDNYEFKIMIRGQVDEWDSQDIYAEEENGEVVNDAVFRRNIEVEEALGVKITGIWVDVGQQYNSLRKAVTAGDATYDAVMMNFESSSNATKNALLVNLNDTAGIDLSKPWWDQNLIKETSVMNKTYFATGDISIMTNDGTWTMMFNKKILQETHLPDIYEIVKAGEWTVDKMLEIGKDVPHDLNGDGVFDHTDRVAFATTIDSVQGLFYSTGNRIVIKDADDLPIYNLSGDALMKNLEKIYEIMRGNENFTMLSGDYSHINASAHLIVQAAFEENRSLFYAEVMQCVIRLRQMDTEFGIIPLPKADSSQEKYMTNIHAWASAAISIPKGGSNDERTSNIIEALAYGGYKYITPAYYDIALKTKHARDEESAAMLDIIFAGRSADLGYIDAYGGTISSFHTNINSRNNTFASTIEKLESKIQRDIERAIERYATLD